jgi:hypothetical protein
MLINGLNTVGGGIIPFAALSLNLQYELLFIYGSPAGIVTHFDQTVYLEKAHLQYFEQIQNMLWDRGDSEFPKALYKCVELTSEQERDLFLRMGWATQRMCDQVEIVLGTATDDGKAIITTHKDGRFTFERASRLCPVIIKDYDEPGEAGMSVDDCIEDGDYNCDDGGNFYRVSKS